MVKIDGFEASIIHAKSPKNTPVLQPWAGPETAGNKGSWFSLPMAKNMERMNGKSTIETKKSSSVCCYFDQERRLCRLQNQEVDARPIQCRTYPIWPDFISTEFDWLLRGPSLARGSYEASPLGAAVEGNDWEELSADGVARALAVHCAHNSGDIEGMNFDEATSIIADKVLYIYIYINKSSSKIITIVMIICSSRTHSKCGFRR